jgi:hypothetical protein
MGYSQRDAEFLGMVTLILVSCRRGNVARATLDTMSTANCDAITKLALAAPDDDRLAGLKCNPIRAAVIAAAI